MLNISRRNFVTGLASAAVLGLAACNSDTTSSDSAADSSTDAAASSASDDSGLGLVTEGTLTVATSPDYPPFENLDGDEYVGFDMDLCRAVAEKLGLEVEFKNLQFDAITTAIAAGGQADVGCSGMSITPEREKEVAFTDPYYVDDQCVIAMTANTNITSDNYQDALNQEGVIIAVQSGTTGESFAKENFPNATVQPYGNATDCFAALQSNTDFSTDRVLAVCTNLAVGEQMIAEAYTDAQIVGKSAEGEEYAMAVSLDNTALLDALNGALAELDEDGTIDDLTAQWLG